jgi:hypothetical protein
MLWFFKSFRQNNWEKKRGHFHPNYSFFCRTKWSYIGFQENRQLAWLVLCFS